MNILETIETLKLFLGKQITSLANNNPLIAFAQPIITKVVNNKLNNMHGFLSMLADDSGEIDTFNNESTPAPTAEVTVEPSQMPAVDNQNVGGHPWLWLTFIILFVLLSAAVAFVGFLHVRKYGFGKSKKKAKKPQKI